MTTRRVLSLGLGSALCAVLSVTKAADVVLPYGHQSVSSDNTQVPAVAERGASMGVDGFAGTAVTGERLDKNSEYPASVASKAEMDDLSQYKPLIPRYARGRTSIESVIGQDARYRIYPKGSGHPERAIGLITLNQPGGSYGCTGWMINQNTVATAGHCVHTGGPGGSWSTNVIFYPGRDGSSSPYGSCTAERLYSVSGWTESGFENYDYGAIKLNCTVGNTVGWFGFFWQTASLVGLPVQVSGYPGDKPSGTQWSTSGDIEVSETFKTRYKHDTYGGQSGGPVFQTDRVGSSCRGACVNTIHAYGVSGGRNSGTRITKEVFDNLIAWSNAP